MHDTFDIGNRHHATANNWSRQTTVFEFILLPEGATRKAIKGVYRSFVVAQENIATVGDQCRDGRNIARPNQIATLRHIKAGNASLEGNRADLPTVHQRGGNHVGDTIQFSRTFRDRYSTFPYRRAILQRKRDQLTARITDKNIPISKYRGTGAAD